MNQNIKAAVMRSNPSCPAKSLLAISLAALTLCGFGSALSAAPFVHPGLLQSRADLERMKLAVAAKEEPIYAGYEVFRTNAESQLTYRMRGPLATVGRNPDVGQATYDSDANAAYQCAIMWCITGDRAYADKSKAIINAWSATLKAITGRDAILMAGLGPFKMINAAEILRYTGAGWSPTEIQQTEKHFREVIYPVIKDFASFANGNWDAAAMKTLMAIGVFCDDRAMFERALRYYVDGLGDGSLTHYIINDTGQCQESGRDQRHTQLGLAHLGDCCEIAWHQGLNLYGYDDNRLLKGFEYTARYNLGEEVPFTETVDQTGQYHHTQISSDGRGQFRAVFEEIYNAYAHRLGIPAPFTQQVVERIRPEGVGVPGAPQGADHPGFGTLLFAPPNSGGAPAATLGAPAPPGGLTAKSHRDGIALTWIASNGARNYTVKRAKEGDDYTIIARDNATNNYTDTGAKSGEAYRYLVSAANAAGESDNSYPASVTDAPAGSRVSSPDRDVSVSFDLRPGGIPVYTIEYFDKPIVLESRLGLEPGFTNGFQLTKVDVTRHAGSWTNAFGERRVVPDNYNELTVDLLNASGQPMRLTFQAYNEGAAFRYSFPEAATNELRFTGEQTEFCFPAGTLGYEEHGTEGEYHRVPVADIQPQCERPLTLEYAAGFFAGLCEADNENYPRMLLSPLPGAPDTLVSALGETTANTPERLDRMRNDPTARLHGGDATPWRVFIVGQKPGDLLERNYLLLNLNPPCALADTSWIKPGKAMRDTMLATTNAKAIIDFAATAGLRYVLFDSGWYGPENAESSDPTAVARPNLDIPEVVRYGKEKGVGLLLYVNRRHVEKMRDVIFPLYEKWGVAGVKIGFVNVGPQTDTAWLTETIQKAAEHHLVLDIHDGYRPTGLARTWPNLLTVEGIRGNEHMPSPEHNCTLPFTRALAGQADYTVCYYTSRKQTTFAHQLAMAVVSFSPLQFIFWYDKPSDYHGEPEIEFFRHVPTVWEDTKVLAGEIGQYAAIARRSGDDWFVGAINDHELRTMKLPLKFLDPGRHYLAHVYADDNSVPTRTHVGITTRDVDSSTVLEVPLQPAGGEAVWITPVGENKP
jgi:alpha-glucosidase